MAKKKREADSTLPVNRGEESMEPSSSITYASDVIAIIAGLAASEVEGIAGMSNVSGGLLSKNRNITRGIKVEVGTEEVSVDLFVTVEYGTPIQRAARDAQESVKKSIESMTGLHVVRVDVHVQGVSFEKEMNALQAGAGKAKLESGDGEGVTAAAPQPGVEETSFREEERASEPDKDPVNEIEDSVPEGESESEAEAGEPVSPDDGETGEDPVEQGTETEEKEGNETEA